jgi:hypothetical protein
VDAADVVVWADVGDAVVEESEALWVDGADEGCRIPADQGSTLQHRRSYLGI